MGFGLPAAICRATFGRPDRTVCVFMGDGGLQMNLSGTGDHYGTEKLRKDYFAEQ